MRLDSYTFAYFAGQNKYSFNMPIFAPTHDHTTNMIAASDLTQDNYDIIADRTIKEASRVISFDAPITSPEMPPKDLFEKCCISAAIASDTLSAKIPK